MQKTVVTVRHGCEINNIAKYTESMLCTLLSETIYTCDIM